VFKYVGYHDVSDYLSILQCMP